MSGTGAAWRDAAQHAHQRVRSSSEYRSARFCCDSGMFCRRSASCTPSGATGGRGGGGWVSGVGGLGGGTCRTCRPAMWRAQPHSTPHPTHSRPHTCPKSMVQCTMPGVSSVVPRISAKGPTVGVLGVCWVGGWAVCTGGQGAAARCAHAPSLERPEAGHGKRARRPPPPPPHPPSPSLACGGVPPCDVPRPLVARGGAGGHKQLRVHSPRTRQQLPVRRARGHVEGAWHGGVGG